MGVDIEWIVGIMRVGDKLEKFHDPFDFSTVVLKDDDTVIFKGAYSNQFAQLVKERNNIRKKLPPDVKRVVYERIDEEGIITEEVIEVNRYGSDG